jgi:uncharacterized protein YdaU (DUF1376 family)
MKTAPAFQFYASDTMADKRYRLMSLEERGLYLSMLCECWVNRGVPANPDELGQWLGYSAEKIRAALTQHVLSFFADQKGEIYSPELEKYRTELLAQREKMSQGGKLGALRKVKKGNDSLSPPPEGYPQGYLEGSRVETSRDEMSRGEYLRKEDSPVDSSWVKDYDDAQFERL